MPNSFDRKTEKRSCANDSKRKARNEKGQEFLSSSTDQACLSSDIDGNKAAISRQDMGPPEACYRLEVTALQLSGIRACWAQPIPTPVTRTQARGGCSALAMALAKVLVVSTRLLTISLQKASPHL